MRVARRNREGPNASGDRGGRLATVVTIVIMIVVGHEHRDDDPQIRKRSDDRDEHRDDGDGVGLHIDSGTDHAELRHEAAGCRDAGLTEQKEREHDGQGR